MGALKRQGPVDQRASFLMWKLDVQSLQIPQGVHGVLPIVPPGKPRQNMPYTGYFWVSGLPRQVHQAWRCSWNSRMDVSSIRDGTRKIFTISNFNNRS